MVQIQNTDAINAIRNAAKLSISEGFPQNLLPNVQPVMDMTPSFHRLTQFAKSTTRNATAGASGTVFTASADRDTYITGVHLAFQKDAACDGPTASINAQVTINGQLVQLCRLPTLTLTAQDFTQYISFEKPIKIDRGTNAQLGAYAYTAGNVIQAICYYGYEVEAQV